MSFTGYAAGTRVYRATLPARVCLHLQPVELSVHYRSPPCIFKFFTLRLPPADNLIFFHPCSYTVARRILPSFISPPSHRSRCTESTRSCLSFVYPLTSQHDATTHFASNCPTRTSGHSSSTSNLSIHWYRPWHMMAGLAFPIALLSMNLRYVASVYLFSPLFATCFLPPMTSCT